MSRRQTLWLSAATIGMVALVFLLVLLLSSSPLADLALIATATSPILIVVSAVLIVRQVEEAANAVRGQLFDATASRMLDLDRVFIESPELRPLFYDGCDIDALSPIERQQALAVAEMLIDFLDTELLRRQKFHRALGDLPSITPWVRGLIRSSPVICRRLAQDAALGDEGWYDEIAAHYREAIARGDASWPRPDEVTQGPPPPR